MEVPVLTHSIRPMEEKDKPTVLDMMQTFYSSPAVLSNGSKDIFEADIEACLNDSPFLEGYVFEEDGATVGYAMLAKSFSTEFGKPCIWIEDLYVEESFRGRGFGKAFLDFVDLKYPTALKRLEVEEENERALHVYKSCGFEILPYLEMKK